MWHRVVCCKFKFKQIYQPIIHLWGRRQFKYDFPVFIHEPRHDHVCRTGGIPWRPMKMSRQLRSRWHYLGVGGRSPGIHQLRRLVGCRACLDSGEEIFFAPAGDRIPIPGLRSPRLKSKIFRFREDRLNWYSWQHCEGRPDWCSGCVGEGGRKTAPPPRPPRALCVRTLWALGSHSGRPGGGGTTEGMFSAIPILQQATTDADQWWIADCCWLNKAMTGHILEGEAALPTCHH